MDREDIYRIRKELKNCLSENRYQHSLGVEYTAACLAMRFGADAYKAELAGLLHDCAKEYSIDELRKMQGSETGTDKTIHAVCAPIVAREKYGITDEEILSSIRWHTTGKADMALLDKILYVADYIEPCRVDKPKLDDIRKIAFENLGYAVYMISDITISFVKLRNLPMDNYTIECYEWMKKNM